jgi:hypothetical protein
MSSALTIELDVCVGKRPSGHKSLSGAPTPNNQVGRVPRISRLMALAIRFESLVRSGAVTDYATLADLGYVTRARVSQIMNLLCLATDIQEQILFLPLTEHGRDAIILAKVQRIAALPDWRRQRVAWQKLEMLSKV